MTDRDGIQGYGMRPTASAALRTQMLGRIVRRLDDVTDATSGAGHSVEDYWPDGDTGNPIAGPISLRPIEIKESEQNDG